LKLALVHPPGEGDQHEPEWIQDSWHSFRSLSPLLRVDRQTQVDSSRSDFRTKRAWFRNTDRRDTSNADNAVASLTVPSTSVDQKALEHFQDSSTFYRLATREPD
jgi:hypothetical protein